jgi:hypothetical protein
MRTFHAAEDKKPAASQSTQLTQAPIISFMTAKTTPLPTIRKSQIDAKLQKYVVSTMAPLSIVDKPTFREFVKELEPRYVLPSRNTLTKSLRATKEELTVAIKDEVHECSSIALTHDSWTSLATESYETVTCHYIHQWVLKSKVLITEKIEGSHNSEHIAAFLLKVKSDWGLPDDIVITTDNAAVEVKSCRDLGWPRLGCAGHTINLVVRDVLQDRTLSKIVSKGRNVVSFFHKSPQATDCLKAKQEALLPKDQQAHKLMQDVCTRWNSTLDMLKRLLEMNAPLHALAQDPEFKQKDLKPMLFTLYEQAIVERLVGVLQPFKNATELLGAENQPTLSMVVPVLQMLRRSIQREHENNEGEEVQEDDQQERAKATLNKMKANMQAKLEKRFTSLDLAEKASMLDPRSKSMICNVKGRGTVKATLLHLAREVNGEKKTRRNSTTARRTSSEKGKTGSRMARRHSGS